MAYNYPLNGSITKDISKKQGEELLEKGFVYNEKEKTYDFLEEKKEIITYIDFEYIDEMEVDSPLSEIEIYEMGKVKNASYRKKESGFFGFFKNLKQKFFPITEKNINELREKKLEILLAKGEIFDLSFQEKMEAKKTIKKMTQKEISNINTSYNFIRKTNETKKEKIEIRKSRREEIHDFEKKYSTKKIVSSEEIDEEIVVEKIVVERRKVMSTNIYFYVPGIWSRKGNHTDGTIAEFSCDVEIIYLSGFNPLNSRYLNKKELQEEIINIIEEEHPNTFYIRDRNDGKDGFNIESSKVIS